MNIVSLIGYVILAIAFGLKLKDNLNLEPLLLFGSVIIIAGYLITGIHHGINIANKKLSKYNYGHLTLSIYYLLSFLSPINDNKMDSDVLALLGHVLLIRNNDQFNLFGMISLFLYFVLSIIRSFKDLSGIQNKLILLGSSLVVIFLNSRLYQDLFQDKIKKN